ncbi:MAG: hypothetical protein ACRBB4_01580 [Neptuniibacter sp.]
MANTDLPHIELADGKTKKLSDKHLAKLRRGAELTRLIKDQQSELKKINDELKKDIGPGVSIVLPEELRSPIAESVSTSIGDADALKDHLGTRRFNQVVNRTETLKPTDTLLNMAETDEVVNQCLNRKTSVSVKYLPIKTQK